MSGTASVIARHDWPALAAAAGIFALSLTQTPTSALGTFYVFVVVLGLWITSNRPRRRVAVVTPSRAT